MFDRLRILGRATSAAIALAVAGCTAAPASAPLQNPPAQARDAQQPPYNSPAVRQQNLAERNPYGVPLKWPQAQPATHAIDLTRRTFETGETYFKHLCATEAGRWIYRKDVVLDAIFDMRPAYQAEEWMFHDRYYLEDATHRNRAGPLGYDPKARYARPEAPEAKIARGIADGWTDLGLAGFSVTQSFLSRDAEDVRRNNEYRPYDTRVAQRAYETWVADAWRDRYPGHRYLRVTRKQPKKLEHLPTTDGGKALVYRWRHEDTNLVVTPTDQLVSVHGFSWRGIERSPHDRALGIAGSEWAVFDMKSGELVALRRTFVWSPGGYRSAPDAINWVGASSCPSTRGDPPYLLPFAVRRVITFRSEK